MSDNLRDLKDTWEEGTLRRTLDRFPERRSEFRTESDIPVERIYTPDSVEADYVDDLGFPGAVPFTLSLIHI